MSSISDSYEPLPNCDDCNNVVTKPLNPSPYGRYIINGRNIEQLILNFQISSTFYARLFGTIVFLAAFL